MSDFVIDNSNFNQYFFDVKKNGPQEGQIMARYLAKAELIGGEEKGYVIDLLTTNPKGAEMSVQICQNTFGATEASAIEMCRQMTFDLVSGKSRQEVFDKPYSYTYEKFFWTKKEYVPEKDPHWQVIQITILKEDAQKMNEEVIDN